MTNSRSAGRKKMKKEEMRQKIMFSLSPDLTEAIKAHELPNSQLIEIALRKYLNI